MRKVEAQTLASIADYRLVETAPPTPKPTEALIEVAACGVGYVDALVSLGRYQVKPPLPHTPGQEIGGRVIALGAEVTHLAVGDRVMATAPGGFAEIVAAPAAAVLRIPDALSFEQAAGFRINYVTALHGLRDRARLQPGETLVALGGAGGVGMAAVQVGKRLGARVVVAASTPDKRAFALAHGADQAIDTALDGWRERLKEACGGAPDVVFDPVCGPLFELAFRSLGWRGRHLVVGFAGGPIPALPANLPLMKGAALVGVDVRQHFLFDAALAQAQLDELLQWAAQGAIAPPVGRVFSFEAFAEALQFALSGQGAGKTVLRVRE